MNSNQTRLALLIPVMNEAPNIYCLLPALDKAGEDVEIVFIDGGSTDDTILICQRHGYRVITAPIGRAAQMNAGSQAVNADIYWFLHADCIPPADAISLIRAAIRSGYCWGRFDVRLDDSHWVYRLIGNMMNWRSCLTHVATGDQGIFIRADLFHRIGGFPNIPLMEDIAVSKVLRRHGQPACLRSQMTVSCRRWERQGVVKTTLLMWYLRLRYFLGDSPGRLHRIYYGRGHE